MNDDELREDERAQTSEERSETTTAVEHALVKVPEATDPDHADHPSTEPRDGEQGSLLERDRAESFRRRWRDIQTEFVERPRDSVERADRLVVEVMQQLQASFALARERLESQWGDGSDASTEDLRVALRRYRAFFDRLLGNYT
jgi:hypothetical protein